MVLQEARKWAGGRDKNESLDYSEKSDGVRGASDGDSSAESINMQQKSLVDMQEVVDSDDSEEVCNLPLSSVQWCSMSTQFTLTPKGKTGIRLGSELLLSQSANACCSFCALTPAEDRTSTYAVASGPISVSYACIAWTLCCCQMMQS